MPAAAGDLIRITDKQTYLGQQVLNVYFYRVSDTTPLIGDYLQTFSDSFQDVVLADVVPLQLAALEHTSLYIENISNGVDILEDTTGFPISGDVETGSGMPPYVSYGFQLVRESRVTRNGYKRFAGVPETFTSNGVYDGNPTLIAALEDALGSDFQAGIATYAAPVIPKRPIAVPVGTYEYADISSGLFKGIGTQNTRKFGRGI